MKRPNHTRYIAAVTRKNQSKARRRLRAKAELQVQMNRNNAYREALRIAYLPEYEARP